MTIAKPSHHDALLAAALAYAARGLYVVPLHEPIFDTADQCCGCTCEVYKRSNRYRDWLRAKGKEKLFNPNFKCRTPGKHPRISDWETQATTDPAQIRTWWQKWPTANIGLAAGKSGLLTFDRDIYKEIFGDDSELFTKADKETPTQISQNGGEHLVFAKPEGKTYTNANNTLPPGVDIRCDGGMFTVEPSIGPTGNQWTWEDGYSILECTPRPLPPALEALLDAAHQNSAPAHPVSFTEAPTERPDLIRWRISKTTRELIHNPPPAGERSEADAKVCVSLVYAGATDDEIRSVFQHYPIGTAGKYNEAGPVYLAHTIGKARAWVELHPRPDVAATINQLRFWIRTHSFAAYIDPKFLASDGTYRTDGTDTKVADAVFDVMSAAGMLAVHVGKKRLAQFAGLGSCNTALKALARLGWLCDVTSDPVEGTQVALCDPRRLQQIDPQLSGCVVYNRDQSSANDVFPSVINEYSPHKAAEPFLTGTSKLMRDRIQDIALALDIEPAQAKEDYTHAGLGESALRVIDVLIRVGQNMTAAELAAETGKKVSAIRLALRKLVRLGMVDTEQAMFCPTVYTLKPDIWQRIATVAPDLRTCGLVARRENKRLESAQQWTQKGVAEARDEAQATRLEHRFVKLAQQRIPHLQRLYPELSAKDIESLAYEVVAYKRSPETAAAIRTARIQGQTKHRDTVRLIRELAESFMDVDTPSDEIYNGIMQFGTFDAKLVKAVLQSPKQMANYETLPDIRKRLEHDVLMSNMRMTPAVPGHQQAALMDGAA